MAFDWSQSYSSKCQISRIDPDTWFPTEKVQGDFTSVSIDTDGTDSVPLLQKGSATVVFPMNRTFEEGIYLIEMIAIQGRYTIAEPLATLYFERSSEVLDYGVRTITLTGTSVLTPAKDQKCRVGTYAPKGCNGATWVKDLLSECVKAPIEIVGWGFELNDNYVFSGGTSYLSMAWEVLDAGKWCMQITGTGTVRILKQPNFPKLSVDSLLKSLIMPSVSHNKSRVDLPNRYTVSTDDLVITIENHQFNSDISYEKKGRWVDAYDSSPKRVNGETLYSYAQRKLSEESTLVETYNYKREYYPGLYPFDIVRSGLSDNGIVGDLRILSQKMEYKNGIVVTENTGTEIKEYIV